MAGVMIKGSLQAPLKELMIAAYRRLLKVVKQVMVNTDNSVTRLRPGTCGREITQYLATNDQMPDAGRGGNTGVKEKQTVKTFTIGFGQGLEDGAEEYLRSLATVDGQGYYTADNKEELKNAFQKIFDTVAKAKGSLSSPGYSVNVKSGLEHEDDIYIPVFDRKNTSRWSGNLKKFKLVNDNGKRKIRGKNNKDAVDELGGFTKESKDYWSKNSQPDGLDIQKGGAAELIDPVNRVVYTSVGCSNDCDLTANKLELANNAIDSSVLGINDLGLSDSAKAARRERLINFARGWEEGFYDANATPKGIKRHYMGDMLHSEPLVITYKKDGHANGKKQYIFAGTNEGYLHAFDTADGKEKFAFMPAELLKNQDALLKNEGTYRDHKYGVDGVMSYWHDDKNNNREVDTGESVYLYFGLRRGGRSYYALDITDMDSPKLLWSVTGDKDITTSSSPWASLGQTWSAPYLARVGLSDGSKKEVVIFTGGYDPAEDRDKAGGRNELDSSTKTVETKMGNNIFIVDAKEGTLLWSLRESMGDTTSLKHSLPGGFRMLDVNRNGLVDRLYFADTGGHVWRLDLSESLSKTGDNKSVLTEFANLAGSGVEARKFYNEPDVAMMKPDGKTIFAVSIGSGFRAHPNDKVIQDKMFVLRDVSPYEPLPESFTTITKDELASVSISSVNDVISLTHSGFGDEDKDKGWFLSLPDGEKVLAQAITFDGVITFTTMVPQILTQGVDPCKAPKAFGRLYALNILTGESVIDLDEDDAVNDDDAYIDVVKGEIPGKPQIIFNKFTKKVVSTDADTGEVTKTSCSHPVDIRVGKKRSQVTGYDACRLESVYWNDPQPNDDH
jgi:Tfp pilus tip-associated adhesin PilY1